MTEVALVGVEPETFPFAAVLEEDFRGEKRRRLVVVYALSPTDAQTRSGLTLEKFRPARAGELEAWERIGDRPLTDQDCEALIVLVEQAARKLGKSRLRDVRTGRADRQKFRDSNRYKARRLAQLAAKLARIETDNELDEELEAEHDIGEG